MKGSELSTTVFKPLVEHFIVVAFVFTNSFKHSAFGLWFLAVQRSDFQKDISGLVWVRSIHLVRKEKSFIHSVHLTEHTLHEKKDCWIRLWEEQTTCWDTSNSLLFKFLLFAAGLSSSLPAEGASLQRGS